MVGRARTGQVGEVFGSEAEEAGVEVEHTGVHLDGAGLAAAGQAVEKEAAAVREPVGLVQLLGVAGDGVLNVAHDELELAVREVNAAGRASTFVALVGPLAAAVVAGLEAEQAEATRKSLAKSSTKPNIERPFATIAPNASAAHL